MRKIEGPNNPQVHPGARVAVRSTDLASGVAPGPVVSPQRALVLQRLVGNAATSLLVSPQATPREAAVQRAEPTVLESLEEQVGNALRFGGALAAAPWLMSADTVDGRTNFLGNSFLMNRIAWAFATPLYRAVWSSWGMTLSERLEPMLKEQGMAAHAIKSMILSAPQEEREKAHANPAILLKIDEYGWENELDLRLHLKFGPPAEFEEKSESVPVLTRRTVYGVDLYITKEKDWFKALKTLEQALLKAGVLNPEQYTEIIANPDHTGGGVTDVILEPDRDPSEGKWKQNPLKDNRWAARRHPTIAIGAAAFSSAANLYSTLMHEYQHAKQMNHGYKDNPDVWRNVGVDELEAYFWEIDHRFESGIAAQPALLVELEQHIDTNWQRITKETKEHYTASYKAAKRVIKQAKAELKAGG